ncbi:MAG TPA: SirB2 family protein [Bacteroidia bacterium]|nr:SirB2 family protein [Bacteroidia bacterium]
MVKGILHTHYLVVVLFLFIYVVKTILLLSDKNEMLSKFSARVRIPEMIISTLFLLTGLYLSFQIPFGEKYTYLFWIKIVMVAAAIPLAVIGFKRSNKILASLSLVLITATFGVAEAYHKRKAIPKVDNAGLVDAKILFDNNCASCHGADGKYSLGGAKDLTQTQLDVAGINSLILQGKGMMPAAVQLSPEQARAVSEYVHAVLKAH